MRAIRNFIQCQIITVVISAIIIVGSGACSSVKEGGEPEANTASPGVITNDAQRKAIYENGGNVSPQNANPIPSSREIGLNEKSSEINRKRNIENGSSTNDPSTTPNGLRPEIIKNNNTVFDTLRR